MTKQTTKQTTPRQKNGGTLTTETMSSDIVWGAENIGRVINASLRKTQRLLELGVLPAKKIGWQWCASATRLRQHIAGE